MTPSSAPAIAPCVPSIDLETAIDILVRIFTTRDNSDTVKAISRINDPYLRRAITLIMNNFYDTSAVYRCSLIVASRGEEIIESIARSEGGVEILERLIKTLSWSMDWDSRDRTKNEVSLIYLRIMFASFFEYTHHMIEESHIRLLSSTGELSMAISARACDIYSTIPPTNEDNREAGADDDIPYETVFPREHPILPIPPHSKD